jgi:hypothetical protein
VAALTVLVFPTTLALLSIAAIAALEAYAAYRGGGFPFAEYTMLAVALRYLTPLALIPLITSRRWAPPGEWRAITTSWILRIGLATVFFIHGLEALWLHPGFIDFIIATTRNVLGLTIREATAAQILKIIGVIDIIVALLILMRTWRPLLAWACFWGLLTALSRPLSYGVWSYPEVLVRSSHVVAALAIWWIADALREKKRKQTTIAPKSEPAPGAGAESARSSHSE